MNYSKWECGKCGRKYVSPTRGTLEVHCSHKDKSLDKPTLMKMTFSSKVGWKDAGR